MGGGEGGYGGGGWAREREKTMRVQKGWDQGEKRVRGSLGGW